MTRHMLLPAALVASVAPGLATAASLKTLYTFTGGADGGVPFTGLIAGPHGSLFGTTLAGSASGPAAFGTVFQLVPPAQGQTAWTLSTLYTFTDTGDGNGPVGLVADGSGAIYGVATLGGTFNGTCTYGTGSDEGCGTVYRLTPPQHGQSGWQFTTLYAFTGGSDGIDPDFGLAIDRAGALYGQTLYGGINSTKCNNAAGGCGTIFKLTPPGQGQTAWTKTILHSFAGGRDGQIPGGPLVFGPGGQIYGNTFRGGDDNNANCTPNGCGTVFVLLPPEKGKKAWTRQTLMTFRGTNGIEPVGGLSLDKAGNLYGNGNGGGHLADCVPGSGIINGCGVAFKLSPPGNGGTAWTDTTLFRFTDGVDGSYPWDAPVAGSGAYYMTSSGDEVKNFGSIVKLTPPGEGQTEWKEKTVFSFTNDTNGCDPLSTLLLRHGVFYGTTAGDVPGPASYGTIFSFEP
jgi:uncharacterized protein YceK